MKDQGGGDGFHHNYNRIPTFSSSSSMFFSRFFLVFTLVMF